MRIVAIIAAYNEERFIAKCLDHLREQGVEAYLIDNCSTDRTVEIAETYLGQGLIGIETFPRERDIYIWETILERKEELAASLEADWFMHADPDEIRLPPRSDRTLAQALEEVDEQGYNAVNFLEFTFVPTREAPDHDHPDFLHTMRWYYLYQRHFPFRVTAWKRQPGRVALARSGGHRVQFPGLLLYPESFKMRHYLFLSVPHALEKYASKTYDATELQRGWHDWRARLVEDMIQLPAQSELHLRTSDDELSLSSPRTRHITEAWALPRKGSADGAPIPLPGGQPSQEESTRAGPACIVGAHRSGISMVAELLDQYGLHSRGAASAVAEEPALASELAEVNEGLLGEFGGGWDHPPVMPDGWVRDERVVRHRKKAESALRGSDVPGVWRDPCTSLTLPFWMDLSPGMRVVVSLRNPLEAARSLHQKTGASYAFGLTLWHSYYRHILETISVEERLITHYDAYFYDPRAELRRVLEFLDTPVSEAGIEGAIAEVSPDGRRNRFALQSLVDLGVSPAIVDSYARLCEEAGWIDGGEVYPGSKARDLSSELRRWLHEWNSGRKPSTAGDPRRGGAPDEITVPRPGSAPVGDVGHFDGLAVEAQLLKESYEARIEQYQERYRTLLADYKRRAAHLDSLERQLYDIEHSRTWRLFNLYRRVRSK